MGTKANEDEAHKRYRQRKVREHKERMVEKIQKHHRDKGIGGPQGLDDFGRGRARGERAGQASVGG